MKKLLPAILLLLFCYSTGYAQSGFGTPDYLNDKYGFQDAIFESPLSSFKGLLPVSATGSKKVLRRSTQAVVGKFKTAPPVYTFYKNQLSEIKLLVTGAENVEGVLDALMLAYGEPQQEAGGLEWNTTRVLMTYKTNAAQTSSVLLLWSKYLKLSELEQEKKDVYNQMERRVGERVNNATKAAKDL